MSNRKMRTLYLGGGSEKFKQAIKDAAERAGMSQSDWLAQTISQAAIHGGDPWEEASLWLQRFMQDAAERGIVLEIAYNAATRTLHVQEIKQEQET